MKVKRTIIKNNTNTYKKSSKKIQSLILDEPVQMTGFTRAYTARLLRSHDKCINIGKTVVRCDIGKTSTDQRGRKKKYADHINNYLYEIWKESGNLSAKHMVRGYMPNESRPLILLYFLLRRPIEIDKILSISTNYSFHMFLCKSHFLSI